MESLFGCREEDTNEDISIVLIILEQLSISELFKDILGAVSLIYTTGQCVDWTWNIPLHLPCGVHIQSSLYHQQWIDTWRSEFEQKTNSVLLAC